jgi:hypothetical protein
MPVISMMKAVIVNPAPVPTVVRPTPATPPRISVVIPVSATVNNARPVIHGWRRAVVSSWRPIVEGRGNDGRETDTDANVDVGTSHRTGRRQQYRTRHQMRTFDCDHDDGPW